MNYTIQENVKIVVALLKLYSIRHIVISPGGTNIPFVHAVQKDPFFKCYSVVDERSAMYFAIGLYLQTGEIIATSCTSAQATRNYVPGLTEAFYKHVPIIAITTSKLERFQYQDYMQAPDQCSLPKDCVKNSYDLPPVVDEDTRSLCIIRTRSSILDVSHRLCGPVQLNIRIVDKQQGLFAEDNLPNIRKITRYMAWDDWNDIDLSNRKILIVVGEHRPFTSKEVDALEAFCESHNAMVYTNHLSNFVGKYSINGNLLVESGYMVDLKPDILITIGGQSGDYPLYGALNSIHNVPHWRISEEGDLIDTYGKLEKVFECPHWFFFNRFVNTNKVDHFYYRSWIELENKLQRKVELPFSNLFVAQEMHKDIPVGSIVNFAILNSLRCWSYFNLPNDVLCFSNVSAFGIDGCNSMLFGESIETEKISFIVTGDLAFFYDMNSLGIKALKNNIRILLINNKAGAEFSYMTRNWTEDVSVEKFVAASGHFGSAKGWAEECGFEYLCAYDKNEFFDKKDKFVSKNDKPILFELFTNPSDEVQALELFLSKNRKYNGTNSVKQIAKKVVGEKVYSFIKSKLK